MKKSNSRKQKSKKRSKRSRKAMRNSSKTSSPKSGASHIASPERSNLGQGRTGTRNNRSSGNGVKAIPNRNFTCMYSLTGEMKLSLVNAKSSESIEMDVGKALPTLTPVLNTLEQLAAKVIKPTIVVGLEERFGYRYTSYLEPQNPDVNWPLKRAFLESSIFNSTHDDPPNLINLDTLGDDHTILFYETPSPREILNLIENKNSQVFMLAHEVPEGRHDFYKHSRASEVVIINNGTEVSRTIRNQRSVVTKIPFWYGRSDCLVSLNQYLVPTHRLMWRRRRLAEDLYIYSFASCRNIDMPTVNIATNRLASTGADATSDIQRFFGKRFERTERGFSDGTVLIPFKLLNRIRAYAPGRELDDDYENNLNKFIARQIRNLEISDGAQSLLYSHLSTFSRYVLSWRKANALGNIKNFLSLSYYKDRFLVGVGQASSKNLFVWRRLAILKAILFWPFNLYRTFADIFGPMFHFFAALLLAICTTFIGVVSLPYVWPLLVASAVPVASAGSGGLFVGSTFMILVWILILSCLKVFKDKFRNWKKFKRSVTVDRICIKTTGPIPELSYLEDSETWINHLEYEQNPKSKLKIMEDIPHLRQRPAVLPVGIIFDCKAPIVHSTSQYNLVAALKTRALLYMPPGSDEAWVQLGKIMDDQINIRDEGGYPDSFGYEPEFGGYTYKPHGMIKWEEYASRFPKKKRKVLNNWKAKLENNELNHKHFCYETFIKREKIMGISGVIFTPLRPRVIQGCSNATKACSGPWFLNYSYALKNAWHPKNRIWYCSGYNSDMYNKWINDVVDEFGGIDNCLFVGSDFSKYDVTQGINCMKREKAWYIKLGFLKYVTFGRVILDLKLKYKGYGKGVAYIMVGTRKSGENDTSSGNSKNTGESIGAYWIMVDVDFRMAVLGDDNFTVIRLDSIKIPIHHLLGGLESWIRDLGYKLKVQWSKGVPEKVEFLSSRFYRTNKGLLIGKKPGRLMTKVGYFLKKHVDFSTYLEYLKGSLESLGPVANHVPFLRVYRWHVLKLLAKYQSRVDVWERQYKMQFGGREFDADNETFVGFDAVYGLSLKDEQNFAKYLMKIDELPFLASHCAIDKMVAVDDEM